MSPPPGAVATPPSWGLPSTTSSTGCFETMRVYEGRIFRLPGHLARLRGSATYMGLRLPMGFDELGRRLHAAVRASGIAEAIVRVALIPDQRREASPSIVVQRVPLPARGLYERGIRIAIVPTRRFPIGQIDARAKFSSRLGSVLAVMEAQLRGVDEALLQDGSGSVTESTASNVGMIKDGVVIAPPCWLGLLAGITWEAVVEVAKRLRLPVREVPITRHDLYNADEAFLTSTIKELLPVTVVDGRTIGTGRAGPITQRLHRALQELIARELRLSRLPDVGVVGRRAPRSSHRPVRA